MHLNEALVLPDVQGEGVKEEKKTAEKLGFTLSKKKNSKPI